MRRAQCSHRHMRALSTFHMCTFERCTALRMIRLESYSTSTSLHILADRSVCGGFAITTISATDKPTKMKINSNLKNHPRFIDW